MDGVRQRQRDFGPANARARRLRRTPTRAEKAMWALLRNLPGHHFRRQLPLGGLVYDFGDHGVRLLIEVDGGVHGAPDVAARDRMKDEAAQRSGYRVIRIPNDVVLNEPELALAFVRQAARAEATPTPWSPPHKGEGNDVEKLQ